MGCCLKPEKEKEHMVHVLPAIEVLDIVPHSGPLDILRSLEGVARLWTQNMEQSKPRKKLPLKNSLSQPITGNNHKSISELPFSISTYFFVHSEHNRPDLFKSHTSPQHRSEIEAVLQEEPQQQHCIQHKDSDEAKNGAIPTQIDVHMSLCDAVPNLALNPIPVFSTSSVYSQAPNFVAAPSSPYITTPLSLNDDTSFRLSLSAIENPNDTLLTLTKTVSNNDLFTLNNIDLAADDFMEYDKNQVDGFGASGIVKKAFHFASCKMVAIKQCRSKKIHELKAFEQEAKLYKTFKHNPHIIDIIGYGKDKKTSERMMALEFMDLKSVATLQIHETIKDIHERERFVGFVAHSVLLALVDLHKCLYVHNDIKPDNILLNKYGEIKLSDFGTVLQLQHEDAFLITNNGTQRYQSPEKTIFNIQYTTKTDIWSLGITCYELLFGEKDNDQISYTTNPPYIEPSTDNVSLRCCTFINQCLNIKQDKRASAGELLQCEWFIHDIEPLPLIDKFRWYIDIDIHSEDDNAQKAEHENCLNQDLFFMIAALIIYYSTKTFNDTNSGSIARFHRRVSIKSKHKNYGETFSDEQRIANMAKYALCSDNTVVDRIKVTVAYIKSQLK